MKDKNSYVHKYGCKRPQKKKIAEQKTPMMYASVCMYVQLLLLQENIKTNEFSSINPLYRYFLRRKNYQHFILFEVRARER